MAARNDEAKKKRPAKKGSQEPHYCHLVKWPWNWHYSHRWQTTQQAESLQNWGEELRLRRGLPLVPIVTMSTSNRYIFAHYKLKTSVTLIPQIDRLLEIEVKCYLFHVLPGNRYNYIILKSIR